MNPARRENPLANVISVEVLEKLPPWLRSALERALQETEILRENGAYEGMAARLAVLRKIGSAAAEYLDTEVTTAEAARLTGKCEETIRRSIRKGTMSSRREGTRGHHRVRIADLEHVVGSAVPSYDPIADAQNIAKLRRGA